MNINWLIEIIKAYLIKMIKSKLGWFEASITINALEKTCENKVQKRPIYISIFINNYYVKNVKYSNM